MSDFKELQEIQVLRGLFETEEVLTADLINLAGRAADEIAQFVGPIKGTFEGDQGQVTVAGLGMFFVEEYDTPFGVKERFLKYMPRKISEREKHSGYISHRFGPREQYILEPDTVLRGATLKIYILFAQNLDQIVHKIAAKKSKQVAEIQKSLTDVRDYILNGEKGEKPQND
ncbi:hypothetical protein LLE49_24740 [Alicyclobacillus tolerans]|uniref:hypothetical protein n=1 Tax=Alicyclobacillus tolerans TaxID=90970 RepID=UPI001F2D2BBD|nr:hypothetical protein [Alicyclobacillus tolerans]MCF8567935.1 hypothetical protein [Alicyclobacillus tolerans]